MNNAYEIIQAIQKAILSGDKLYKGIKLPTPQKARTGYQQSTYAFIKAQEIFEQNFTS